MDGTAGGITLTLKVWRQASATAKGAFCKYKVAGLSPDMSFLEMLDLANEQLVATGEDAIAFDHDCREGICGACSVVVNGNPHGPVAETTTCQLYVRNFKDGAVIAVEPFRARSLPIIKDLVIDRSALDRIVMAGGYVSVSTGRAPDAHSVPVPKPAADKAFEAASCIGCAACVAACPNGSVQLFLAAKVTQLALLPQGAVERTARVQNMVATAEAEGFGSCSNTGACAKACPKGISLAHIARLNREYMISLFR